MWKFCLKTGKIQPRNFPGVFPPIWGVFPPKSRKIPGHHRWRIQALHFTLPMPCHTMSHPSREFLYCWGQHMFPSIRWLKWLWFSYVVDGCHDYRLRADEYTQFSHLGWIQKKDKSNTNSSRGYQPDSCFWGVFSPKSWFLQENPLSAIWGFSLRNASLGWWCRRVVEGGALVRATAGRLEQTETIWLRISSNNCIFHGGGPLHPPYNSKRQG